MAQVAKQSKPYADRIRSRIADMSKLGEYLSAKRGELGWSQIMLAKTAKISKATVSQIEAGFHAHPRPDTLDRLAKALKVPYEFLEGLARGLPQSPHTLTGGELLEASAHAIYLDIQRLPIPARDRDSLSTIVEKYLDRYMQ